MNNLAIIPARAGSKRLANKNLRLFCGKQLFLHTMEQARDSQLFQKIHLTTDSSEMKDIAENNGFPVEFLRSDELSNDTAQLKDVIRFVIEEYEKLGESFDNICLLWPTSPLKDTNDIKSSYNLLSEDSSSVLGVSEYQVSVFSSFYLNEDYLNPVFPEILEKRSSEQKKVVCCNSSICWFKTHEFKSQGTWLMERAVPYLMPKSKFVDIDDIHDWQVAEALFKIQNQESSHL